MSVKINIDIESSSAVGAHKDFEYTIEALGYERRDHSANELYSRLIVALHAAGIDVQDVLRRFDEKLIADRLGALERMAAMPDEPA